MRDKLLNWCLVISVVVNLIFIVMVGNSDIFQTQATRNEIVVARRVAIHKPPIKKKPPPVKKKPPPPQKQVKQVTPPPPQQHVVVTHVLQVKVPTPPAPVAVSETRGTKALPIQTAPTAPPETAPPAPTPPAPAPTPPAPVAPPAPPPPAPKPPKPAPPAMPDHAEAIPTTEFDDQITEGIEVDLSTLSSTTIVVRFDVGTDGKPFNFKVMQSSGNNDLDTAAIDACKKVRFEPAVQGGEPIVSRYSHTFTIST